MSLFDDPTVGMTSEPTFSVGELADAIGNAVRSAFRHEVWVRGEIHDLSRPASGHVYLTLVEEREDGSKASLAVMLSASNKVAVNRALTRAGGAVRMVDGTEVRIRGRIDWYAPRGQLQLRMTAIDPAYTLGQLELARTELLARLKTEGLLERNRALPVPLVPLRVGLVTSRGSAAEADFVDELTRSGFSFTVIAVDVRVQGPGAPRAVARGIASAAARACDVVAVVRGGGARTDLAAFDDEQVARAIALCPVPVLTGIGHEIDRSVADDVAHTAEKTPTACAQALATRVGEYLGRVEEMWSVVARVAQRDLAVHDTAIRAHADRVQRCARSSLTGATARLDEQAGRARRAGTAATARAEQRLGRDLGRLTGAGRVQVRDATTSLATAERRLAGRGPRALAEAERALAGVEARVRSLDPERALARGWSITRTGDGRVVRAPGDVTAGDSLITRLAGGEVRSTVDDDA
ncbi:MAG: exodeoxyribonuclease VII large subunit [Acidimicrobiales bacterium]